MTISNRIIHPDLSWQEYCQLPGHSYSSLKAEKMPPIQVTDKMRLGTRVHHYLLDPAKYDWQQAELVLPIAKVLAKVPGLTTLLASGDCELPSTADFCHEGFILPWRGIADIHIARRLIIDFKITEMKLTAAVKFFRYDWQQSGYCAGYDVPQALIVSIHPRTKAVDMAYIKPDFRWWEEKCLTHGIPITN